MGEHESGIKHGIKQMLQDFIGIRVTQQASAEQLNNMKQMLNLKEEELAFAHSILAQLRQEGMQRMNMIGNIGDLVGEIPEYKKRISELSESVDQTQRATQEKVEEISRVQQKQDRDNAMVEKRIEGERLKERAREETNIEELEKLLRGAQEIEVENFQRQMEREKQRVQEQTGILEEENRRMQEKHIRKIQAMNNQLLEANKASDQRKVISMEVVRKDMEVMKQEYERQLGDLARQIAAYKERKAGQTAAKKKKVSFALPGDVSSSATENQDHKKDPFGFIDVPRSRNGHHDSLYNTSSWLSNAGGEALRSDDGGAGWRADATVPRRPVKCAPSFACGTPAAGGEETSASTEDHSGANTHSLNPFKFLTPAFKSGEGGTTTAPRQSIPKIVARPAGKSAFGLASDFCTFALQQQMAGNTELAEGGDAVTGKSEDYRTGVPLHEYTLDEVRLQENPKSEARTDENQGCSYSESGFKRMKRSEEVGNSLQEVLQVSASKLRSMADEGMSEGGDIICSNKESTSNTGGRQGGARKPIKRKLYSETGNGPQILE